jgi:hypothetical protein
MRIAVFEPTMKYVGAGEAVMAEHGLGGREVEMVIRIARASPQ